MKERGYKRQGFCMPMWNAWVGLNRPALTHLRYETIGSGSNTEQVLSKLLQQLIQDEGKSLFRICSIYVFLGAMYAL